MGILGKQKLKRPLAWEHHYTYISCKTTYWHDDKEYEVESFIHCSRGEVTKSRRYEVHTQDPRSVAKPTRFVTGDPQEAIDRAIYNLEMAITSAECDMENSRIEGWAKDLHKMAMKSELEAVHPE